MRGALCAVLSVALTGCALHRTERAAPALTSVESLAAPRAGAPPGDSLETFMAKVRQRASEARPDRIPLATIEGQDPRLAAALAAAATRAEPETYRAVAREYSRLHVADRAQDYLDKALALAK